MANVPTINGQPINASNAYNFYYDICHDKYKDQGITKDSYEANYCKRYLSSDEVEYCETTDEQHFDAGRDELEDHEAADANANGDLENEHGVSNDIMAVATGAVSAAGIGQLYAFFAAGKKLSALSTWGAAIVAAGAALLGGLSMWAVNNLDPNKEARLKNEAQSENDLAAIDAKSGTLQEYIASLEADGAAYQEGQAALLGMYEENSVNLATLKMDLHDAYASGDYAKASELEGQIAELEANMEYDDSELGQYWARINDYQNAILEADGLELSGRNVSEFLCEGKQLKGDFLTCAIGYGVAAISSAICAVYGVAAIKGAWDLAPAIVATALFAGAAVMFGISSYKGFKGNSDEAKCQTAGEKYPGSLDPMHKNAATLAENIGMTLQAYSDYDNQADEVVNGADDAAEGATNVNNGTTAPTGGGSGGGSGNES